MMEDWSFFSTCKTAMSCAGMKYWLASGGFCSTTPISQSSKQAKLKQS
jgi:hypothetical protein